MAAHGPRITYLGLEMFDNSINHLLLTIAEVSGLVIHYFPLKNNLLGPFLARNMAAQGP